MYKVLNQFEVASLTVRSKTQFKSELKKVVLKIPETEDDFIEVSQMKQCILYAIFHLNINIVILITRVRLEVLGSMLCNFFLPFPEPASNSSIAVLKSLNVILFSKDKQTS